MNLLVMKVTFINLMIDIFVKRNYWLIFFPSSCF